MTKKEYLRQVWRIDDEINAGLAEIDRLRRLAESLPTPNLSAVHGGKRGTDAKFVSPLVRIADLEARITSKIDEYIDLKIDVYNSIMALTDYNQRTVLLKRYVNQKKWEEISAEMHISLKHIYRIHGKAIENIVIPNEK